MKNGWCANSLFPGLYDILFFFLQGETDTKNVDLDKLRMRHAELKALVDNPHGSVVSEKEDFAAL